MKSGGRVLSVDTQNSRDLDNSSSIEKSELRFIDTATGERVDAPQGTDEIVFPDGNRYTWQQLQSQYNAITVTRGQNLASTAENQNPLSPEARRNLLNQLEQQDTVVKNAQQQVDDAQAALQRAGRGQPQTTAQRNLDTALQNLRQQQQILRQQLAYARQRGISENELRPYSQSAGESAREGGAGTGSFSASSGGLGMQLPGQTGPAGAQGQNGARGAGLPGGAGYGGYGDPLFAGFQPPTSAAYGAALYMDGMISEGLGQLGTSRREGQKLMMLFFYFARMAESGDPFAMYNFIKFITYIVSKDKARQNIHVGSKLIQLQDLSRQATETLMATPTDDPNKIHEFTKALHQAKSQETTISTSQKLLADMLQEYAHVTESLVNSTKALQDSWARVMRTVSQRA